MAMWPLIGFLALGLLCDAAHAAPKAEPFADGTRLAFIGDSITHYGLYPVYLETFYYTRYPKRKIEFINLGIAGDTAAGSVARYSWDIQSQKVRVASIMFGMNDVSRSLYQAGKTWPEMEKQRVAKLEEYEANLRLIVAKLREDGTKIILLTPSIYDDTSTMPTPNFPGVDGALARCADRAEKFAAEQDIPLIDFHTPMRNLARQLQSEDPAVTMIGPDRTHPQAPGHLYMMALFLQGQGIEGGVSRLAIDARDGKVSDSSQCLVEDVRPAANSLSFRYIAEALPFPVEEAAKPALGWTPLLEEFNQEKLSVTNLEPGQYVLKIDGQEIRRYDAQELARGVNLAVEDATPQMKQAKQVLSLVRQRAAYVWKKRDLVMVEFQAARDLPRPVALSDIQPLLDGRLKIAIGQPWEDFIRKTGDAYLTNKPQEAEYLAKIVDLDARIRTVAQPVPHTVQLLRVSSVAEKPSVPVGRVLKIALVGDSTVAEYKREDVLRGWGQELGRFLSPDTTISNLALGGASTKTFLTTSRWNKALEGKPDYVLIQFGHNDSHPVNLPESTRADGDFKENLRRYISEARSVGVVPILVTPMHRRQFLSEGVLTKELEPYADAVKSISSEMQVPLIDLFSLSGAYFSTLGDQGSSQLTAVGDRIHFTEEGANVMAFFVASSMGKIDDNLKDKVLAEKLQAIKETHPSLQ